MLAVVAEVGLPVTRRLRGGVIEVTMAIEPEAAYVARRDDRDHVAVAASLRHFLEPASLVVVGASARPGTIGGELFRNVIAAGFAGPAYPVNRSGQEVAGVPATDSVRAIGRDVELAVICVPAESVLAAAEDALQSGVRALCVISAGFAEVGADGAERQERLLALVRSYGGRMIGPNCLGVASTPARLNATFAAAALPPGTVGFASQSGALGLAAVEQARGRGLGLSSFVSLGNKADVSSNDLLEYWEDDRDTNVVARSSSRCSKSRIRGRHVRHCRAKQTTTAQGRARVPARPPRASAPLWRRRSRQIPRRQRRCGERGVQPRRRRRDAEAVRPRPAAVRANKREQPLLHLRTLAAPPRRRSRPRWRRARARRSGRPRRLPTYGSPDADDGQLDSAGDRLHCRSRARPQPPGHCDSPGGGPGETAR